MALEEQVKVTNSPASRRWGIAPLFDPEHGTTIVEPPGRGNGYWAGAPGAFSYSSSSSSASVPGGWIDIGPFGCG